MEYYFITIKIIRHMKSFTTDVIYNDFVEGDPIEYVIENNNKFDNEEWKLLFYSEITKEQFDKHRGKL